MGGVGPLVVVEGDPASDADLYLRAGLPSVQVDVRTVPKGEVTRGVTSVGSAGRSGNWLTNGYRNRSDLERHQHAIFGRMDFVA